MTIAATQNSTPLPTTLPDMTALLASLQQAAESLNAILAQLQAQSGTQGQAQTGASTLGGGDGTVTGGGGSGCGCGAGTGAVAGADQLGQTDSEFADAAGTSTGADAGVHASTAHVKQQAKGTSGAKAHTAEAHTAEAAPKAAATSPGDSGAGGLGQQLVDYAKQKLGTKYVYGATGPDAFDCSGFIQYVAKHFGINLPRVASAQATAGRAVSKSELQPGDLVYFQDKGASSVTHIGMYVGGGQYIHAPKPGDHVKISSLSDSYATSTYQGARRIT